MGTVEYVGLDVSKEETAYCVKSGDGRVLARGEAARVRSLGLFYVPSIAGRSRPLPWLASHKLGCAVAPVRKSEIKQETVYLFKEK